MSTINPDILWVAQIGSPRCDPAFDRKHPDWSRLETRYRRTRRAEDLAALPVKEGLKPRLWGVGNLDVLACQVLRGQSPEALPFVAFALGCHARREPDGSEIKARFLARSSSQSQNQADQKWLDEAKRLGGLQLIFEVAAIVQRRAEIGDYDPEDGEGDELADPLDRYALPHGMAPSR